MTVLVVHRRPHPHQGAHLQQGMTNMKELSTCIAMAAAPEVPPRQPAVREVLRSVFGSSPMIVLRSNLQGSTAIGLVCARSGTIYARTPIEVKTKSLMTNRKWVYRTLSKQAAKSGAVECVKIICKSGANDANKILGQSLLV